MLLVLLLAGFAAAVPASASAIQISEFSSGLGSESPFGPLTAGSDGNVWFVGLHSIGRITPSGTITEFGEAQGLNRGGTPFDLALGSNGNVWFTDNNPAAPAIGQITPAGSISESGLNAGSSPADIIPAPESEGNLWFVDVGTTKAIGRVEPDGKIQEFSVSSGLNSMSLPNNITGGPHDGNVWFTDEGTPKAIGRITPGGTITEFSLEPSFPGSRANSITAGPDGNVWFSDAALEAIGRVHLNGETPEISEFKDGAAMAPAAVTAGPDGNVWFIDQLAGHPAVGQVAPSGMITKFALSEGLPLDIVSAAEGNLWVYQGEPGGTSLVRVTTAGALTEFKPCLRPTGGPDRGELIEGPDKNLWFTEAGTPKAIGKLDLQQSCPSTDPTPTTSTSTTTTTGPPTLTGPLRTILSLIRATFGNQQVAVTTPLPTACTASSKTLKVTFSSTTIAGSRATKLRFVRASLYLDRGLKRRRTVTIRSHGKTKTLKTTAYAANEILSSSPAIARLAVTGLKSGAHTLKLRIFFRQTVKLRGRTKTTTIVKTLTVPFRVC